MKCKWLITKMGDDGDINRLYYAVLESGREAEIKDLGPFYEHLEVPSQEKACVVVTGPISITRMAYRNRPHWVPGSWHNHELFKCSAYYTYWGEYITQHEYAFLPFGEIKRRKKWLYDNFAVDGTIFLRPDYGEKAFCGELICEERFDSWYNMMVDNYNVDPICMSIVGKPNKIRKELRLVIADGKVITGSTYRINKTIEQVPLEEQEDASQIIEFAEKMTAKVPMLGLPPVYVLDIAQEEDRYSVMEVGCITCAGLYASNISKVVESASVAAEKCFDEIYT